MSEDETCEDEGTCSIASVTKRSSKPAYWEMQNLLKEITYDKAEAGGGRPCASMLSRLSERCFGDAEIFIQEIIQNNGDK